MSPPGLPDAQRPHFRAFARRPVKLPAVIESYGTRQSARVLDLSLGGAGLVITELVDVGTEVTLSIEAPHRWEPIRLKGKVVWMRPPSRVNAGQIGVAFERCSGPNLRALTELLATRGF